MNTDFSFPNFSFCFMILHPQSLVNPGAMVGARTRVWAFAIVHTTAPQREYTAADWWWHYEEGLHAFQNEFIKFVYYQAKHYEN